MQHILTDTFPVPTSHKKGRKIPTHKIKFYIAYLENLWHLPAELKSLVTIDQMFISTLDKFLDNIEPEYYPETYQDKFFTETDGYFVKHLFCSGQYLDDLHADHPYTPIAYKLRSCPSIGVNVCLVRPWDKKWSRQELVQFGAIEV